MGTLIGKVKNNPLEEAVNQMSGLKYFFETPFCGNGLDESIFKFKPLPLSSYGYELQRPLKEYIKVEEIYEVTEDKKYLNITFLQPFIGKSGTPHMNPHLFIYFDYLKENLGISKIVFNIDNPDIHKYLNQIILYPGGLGSNKSMVKLQDFDLHVNNMDNTNPGASINLCNVNELKNVKLTSNTPHKSKLDGIRWRFAFTMTGNSLAYRDLYLNSEFIMSHKNNLNNHTNNIPGGVPISIDCNFENVYKFTDESENGFLYNFFKRLYEIDKVNYPCMISDFLPDDMVMNINNEDKYYMYMTNTSSKHFISVEDEINKLNTMSSGGIQWKLYKGNKYFGDDYDIGYDRLFIGISV